MLRLDPVCQVTLPTGMTLEPARLLADHTGRAAVWTPNNPHPAWQGLIVNLDEQAPTDRQGHGPWTLRTATGDAVTASRYGGCRCGYGDLLSRGERDLAPLDIPA